MHLASSSSIRVDAEGAADEAFEALAARLGRVPDMMFLFCSAGYDASRVASVLSRAAPNAGLHGGTSCLGIFTQEGVCGGEGAGLGLLGFADPNGAYGVGASLLEDDPEAAAVRAVEHALRRAGRTGELPAGVVVTAAPGSEERILSAITGVFGTAVPVVGGSSADDNVQGSWRQIAHGDAFSDAVVASVLFPSTEPIFNFQSGYEPTSCAGRVTRASGRVVFEIDGRPAAVVYDEWTEGRVLGSALVGGGNVLMKTTLRPLGTAVPAAGDYRNFGLLHPDRIGVDGSMTLFASTIEGDELVLMRGTADRLVGRAGRVAKRALDRHGLRPTDVAGALVFYCAGCMLTVRDRLDEVVQTLDASLGGSPFLGAFTFGEQGCFEGSEARHGNLMISTLILPSG